jgi:hypothetical protein
MDQTTVASGKLEYLAEQSRAEQWGRACFKAAIFLRMAQPVLLFSGTAILVVLSTVFPVAAQTGGPIISGGNPNAPITGIQNLVTLGVVTHCRWYRWHWLGAHQWHAPAVLGCAVDLWCCVPGIRRDCCALE